MSRNNRPKFKAWISKYALTTGIYSVQVEQCVDIAESMVSVIVNGGTANQCFHGEGRDWHRTEEGAMARAAEMAAKKVNSLKRQLSEMQAKSIDFAQRTAVARNG